MFQYRFSVTGAQGVGKTTLARSLYEKCCTQLPLDCTLLSGIGTRIRERGYPIGSQATVETIYAFAAEHLKRERQCPATIIVQDRCLLDMLGYARALGKLSRVSLEMVEQVVLSSCIKMDAIFYLPICEELRDAKEARENPQFRVAVAQQIEIAARDLGLVLHEITGTHEERLEKAFTFVRHRVEQLPL